MSLRLNQASKPQHRALRLPRRRRPRRSRIPAPRELRRRRRRLCARFQSLPQRATRHPASRPLTASPRIKIRNQLWSAPRKHGVYGLANKPAQRPAGNKKKKWVAACHPFLFGRPVRPPRGPPQTIVVRLGAIQRAGLSLGVRLAYCSKARRSTFTAFGGKFFTPSQSPDRLSHAAKRLFQRSVFFHRKTNHSVQFHSGCGVLVTTRRQLASRSSRVTACPRAKKKGRSMRSGPVRSFVVKAESEVRRFCLSSVPGDFRMQARATTTSTASRSHSTSDHLLSVVAAANKLALFGRFEKPARLLVPEHALR